MRCLLLSRYSRLGASSRVRTYQYLTYLEDHGVHVTVAPLVGDDYVQDLYAGHRKKWAIIIKAYLERMTNVFRSSQFDLLWVERELFPWLPSFGIRFLVHRRIPYVVDYDDAVFHRYEVYPNFVVRNLLRSKIDYVMRHSRLIIAGNRYLADRAIKAGAEKVEILPSVVDLERYSVDPPGRHERFTIGWIGSPATKHYLHLIAPALADLCKDNRARVVLVGAGSIELPHVPLEILPWSEETEVASIQDFDVGIMPLPDDPWTRGKCGYKLIQYMACGRPVVASPVGVNEEIVEGNVNGFIARTAEDWVRLLTTLRNDPNLCKRMGMAGRKKVEERYSLQVTAPRLLSLLEEAARTSEVVPQVGMQSSEFTL